MKATIHNSKLSSVDGRRLFDTRGADGSPVSYNEQKREETLHKALNRLQRRFTQRTRELEGANAKLRALDRLKSEFLANMSHELRTPLNAIIGFSELMYIGKLGPLSGDQKEYIGDVLTSGNQLLSLINDVLDLSKVEAARMEVLNSTFMVETVIAEAVQNIATMMSVKELQLIREIPLDIPRITTDRRKLFQILLNLASNAVKFTDQGEICIHCEIEDSTMRMSVADSGIGIKAADLRHLFQPFFQCDSSLRKRHEGTGLGLHLSQKLAVLLGGKLVVESKYGKGSTFTVILPLTPTKLRH
jgi:signal transduction histidine kinase